MTAFDAQPTRPLAPTPIRRRRRRSLDLAARAERVLRATAPFHFRGTVFKPSHFPSPDLHFDGVRYWQTMRFQDNVLGIRLEDIATSAAPQLRATFFSARPVPESVIDGAAEELSCRFDLGSDYRSFVRACDEDPVLKRVVRRWRGMRVSCGMSLYEFLAITTVLQNTTVRRSVQMLAILFDRFGQYVTFDGQRLAAFWPQRVVAAVEESELRAMRLGYRARTLKRQAEQLRGAIFDEQALRRLPSAELRERLLSIYGVGPASVWYLMFEVFKRYDAFDHISPWEQKILSRVLYDRELVPETRILRDAERRWGPWKMLAVHYLFEDLFWQRRSRRIEWLEKLIRL